MDERDGRDDRLSQRPPAEGVRIIRADEAQAALDAGQAAGRRPDDELRFGDVPPAPSGPRPTHRFPLPGATDPASLPPPEADVLPSHSGPPSGIRAFPGMDPAGPLTPEASAAWAWPDPVGSAEPPAGEGQEASEGDHFAGPPVNRTWPCPRAACRCRRAPDPTCPIGPIPRRVRSPASGGS